MAKRDKNILEQTQDQLRKLPYLDSTTVARLVMVVEYDNTPDRSELEALIEKARELGGVEIAEYHHLAPTRESLV